MKHPKKKLSAINPRKGREETGTLLGKKDREGLKKHVISFWNGQKKNPFVVNRIGNRTKDNSGGYSSRDVERGGKRAVELHYTLEWPSDEEKQL